MSVGPGKSPLWESWSYKGTVGACIRQGLRGFVVFGLWRVTEGSSVFATYPFWEQTAFKSVFTIRVGGNSTCSGSWGRVVGFFRVFGVLGRRV